MSIPGREFVATSAVFFMLLAGCARDRLANHVDLPVSKQREALALSGIRLTMTALCGVRRCN